VQVGAQEFGNKVAKSRKLVKNIAYAGVKINIHIFQRGDENIAETDDLKQRVNIFY
jgi:hypothetical protein